jgi:hypothetical protein
LFSTVHMTSAVFGDFPNNPLAQTLRVAFRLTWSTSTKMEEIPIDVFGRQAHHMADGFEQLLLATTTLSHFSSSQALGSGAAR